MDARKRGPAMTTENAADCYRAAPGLARQSGTRRQRGAGPAPQARRGWPISRSGLWAAGRWVADRLAATGSSGSSRRGRRRPFARRAWRAPARRSPETRRTTGARRPSVGPRADSTRQHAFGTLRRLTTPMPPALPLYIAERVIALNGSRCFGVFGALASAGRERG